MDAAAILRAHLDEVSAAALKNGWETYREGISLPSTVITHAESKVISTEDDLRAGYDTFRMTLMAQRVTDYIRLVDQAEQLDRGLIPGSYVSHLIAGGRG